MGKVSNIIKAFSNELPVDEKWYQERLEACAECPENSDNDAPMSATQKLVQRTACGGGPICTACGCCISRKAAVKEETCGLVEKGLAPKWKKLKVNSKKLHLGISFVENTKAVLLLNAKGQPTIEAFFDPEKDLKLNFGLEFEDNNSLKIISVIPTCGCTASEVEIVDGKRSRVFLDVSTKGFSDIRTTKHVTVNYNGNKQVIIRLDFLKK